MTSIDIAVATYDYWKNDLGPVLRIIAVDEDGNDYVIDVQDKRLTPRMYIDKKDIDEYLEILEDVGERDLVIGMDEGLEIYNGHPSVRIYTKYPEHIGELRQLVPIINTYNGDIKWEKMVFQLMKWSNYLHIENYDEYTFTPLDNITSSDNEFHPKFNILYWDIETDNSKTLNTVKNVFLVADKVPIISYVAYFSNTGEYIYYGFKSTWKEEIYYEQVETKIPSTILENPLFHDYNRVHNVCVKRFNDERKMHLAFINDFNHHKVHHIMTFNGRGGVFIRGGKNKRQWNNGYDMPLFYNRCKYLGLLKDLQRLSPFPYTKYNTKVYKTYNEVTREIIKYEVNIKGVVQHDFYYDEMILKYSSNDYMLKRHNLDSFLEYYIGMRKVEHKGTMVWELFQQDEHKEMIYNIIDVEGMVALDMYFSYIDDVITRGYTFGSKPGDGIYTTKVHDHINLFLTSSDYVFNTRGNIYYSWEGMLNSKVGGHNLDVIPGLYNKTIGVIIDYHKLYPTINMSVNADVRTKINLDHFSFTMKGLYLVTDDNERYLWNNVIWTPAGFFRKDIKSLNTIVYDLFIKARKKIVYQMQTYEEGNTLYDRTMYKVLKTRQFSYKGLTNGKFGGDGYSGSRYYDQVIYNNAPAVGQMMLKMVIEYIQSLGYIPIFASTDSVMFMTKYTDPMEAWNYSEHLCDIINNEIIPKFVKENFNIDTNYISIGTEKAFDAVIMMTKRTYILSVIVEEHKGTGRLLDTPYPYYKGIQMIRSDNSKFIHDFQVNLIDLILTKSKDEVLKYIEHELNIFHTHPWKYICNRSGIKGDIETGKGQKYDACRLANKILGKRYTAGVNPLLGLFSNHPSYINGEYLPRGQIALAFDENDQWSLRKLGFELNYEKMKNDNIIKRADDFLVISYGKSYKELISDRYDIF